MLSVTLRQLEYAVAVETHGGVSADGKTVRHVTISDSESVEPVLLIQARNNALSTAAESMLTLIKTMRSASQD